MNKTVGGCEKELEAKQKALELVQSAGYDCRARFNLLEQRRVTLQKSRDKIEAG